MRITFLLFFALSALAISVASAASPAASASPARVTTSLDANWRFLQSNTPLAAEQPAFDDTAWRTLNVPHDWSIEGTFDQNAPTRGSGAFLPSGIGWYRKHLTLPADFAARRVFVEFDGVMANSDVWINGQLLGHRPFGYVSFRYELTGKLNFAPGAANILAVRADTSAQPASRWYSGAGIYRHVRLIVTDPVHLDQWATFVSTPGLKIATGQAKATASAVVRVQTSVINQSAAAREVALRITLLDPSGKTVATADTAAQSVAAGQTTAFEREFTITSPWLWDLATPQLYQATVAVHVAGAALDNETVSFGIRDAHFEPATGFWLNGRNFKLQGVCLHHDGGAFGAAVPVSAWERRLTALQTLGVNAIRTAHNPVAPEFLEACDRLGLVVMDEMFDCWTVAKNPADYHLFFNEWSLIDTRDTVRRDRNHPSVILYSAGNEIHDTPDAALANKILAGLVATFHENDSTRPVTQALFRPNRSHDYDNGLADLLDVVGQNYRENEIIAAYHQKPTRMIVGTENGHDLRVWAACRDNPFYAGQFLWAGIDYLGESRRWPTISSSSGLLDRTGAPRALAFQRQSWWSGKPMVRAARRTAPERAQIGDPGYEPAFAPTAAGPAQRLFSDWTPAKTAAHDESVEVYSNCDSVELFLNNQSLGVKPRDPTGAPLNWKVAYAPGTLRAVASSQGKIVATHELRTAGVPTKLLLKTERTTLAPDWDEVVYVTASVVDADGVVVPGAKDLVTFKTTGPGAVVAVDSGDNTSSEPFQATARRAYQGTCIAIVRATTPTGRITLTASAPGLADGTVSIEAIAPR